MCRFRKGLEILYDAEVVQDLMSMEDDGLFNDIHADAYQKTSKACKKLTREQKELVRIEPVTGNSNVEPGE